MATIAYNIGNDSLYLIILLLRKRIFPTASGAKFVRLSSRMRPQTLKALSDGAEDAGMHKMDRASFESAG